MKIFSQVRQAARTFESHSRHFGWVDRYFKGQDLTILTNEDIVRSFVEGSDPIPVPLPDGKYHGRGIGRSAWGFTRRPWKMGTMMQVCSSISVLVDWAIRKDVRKPQRAYLERAAADSLYFPDKDACWDGHEIRIAKTATPTEYRAWLDHSWETRFAVSCILEGCVGLREEEIEAADSYLKWVKCDGVLMPIGFHVGESCKTGNRDVMFPNNVIIMLSELKRQGRLEIRIKNRQQFPFPAEAQLPLGHYHKLQLPDGRIIRMRLDKNSVKVNRDGSFIVNIPRADQSAETRLHARMGYEAAASILMPGERVKAYIKRNPEKTWEEAQKILIDNWRKQYPLGYYGDGTPWGLWITKTPRHTALSIFCAATCNNSGLSAGYGGHRYPQIRT